MVKKRRLYVIKVYKWFFYGDENEFQFNGSGLGSYFIQKWSEKLDFSIESRLKMLSLQQVFAYTQVTIWVKCFCCLFLL